LLIIQKDFLVHFIKKIYNIYVLWYNISMKEGIS